MSHDEVRMPDGSERIGYPVLGETIEGLQEYLIRNGKLPDAEAFKRVREDAVSIIRSARHFDEPDGSRTGLVVGYVQSGKTQSMTAVSSLARDNGCRIVILLAGVTNILLTQSTNRFRDDLRGAAGKATAWLLLSSADGYAAKDVQALQRAVQEWKDPVFAHDRRTLLLVVLKNHSHLENLHWLLTKADLRGIPALIIDDEADQAGLNAALDEPQGSTTYRRIAQVRAALPHHTYLQYTATPQAPLLIALDDMLSPAFAELVRPGKGYTGGNAFFGLDANPNLVITIPDDEVFKPGEPPDVPPDSLLAALRVFFVGCAVASIRGKPSPRSMLIHPSPRTADHGRYLGWVSEILARWTTMLRTSSDDRTDVLNEFREAYRELGKTDAALPSFDRLEHPILVSLGRVSLKEVNSQDGSEIDWDNAEEHILVGGEKLNRGFTVEGLTVTYMPRDAGGWNADTLQQRARFFGYKAGFLGLCRLYLHKEVIAAFRSYVRHEEDIRKQLETHRGRPLREWRRAFFLDARMRPTRTAVLSDPYYKVAKDKVWFTQRFPQDANLERNRGLLEPFEAQHALVASSDHHGHAIADASLKELYEQVMVTYDVRGSDVPSWYGQLVTIADILEHDPNARVMLMHMKGESGKNRRRTPDAKRANEVKLQQGPSSSKTKSGRYPGDFKLVAEDRVTVQLHWLDLLEGETVRDENIPALAVHIPESLRKDDVGVSLPK